MRVGFLRVSFCAAFPLSFRANLYAKTVVCLVFFELLFSLEKEREKTVPTRETLYARAPRLVGERDATKTRAKKRQRRVAYLFFRTNSTRTRSFCVCVRVFAHQSRVAERARVWQKTLCGDCFPLKKRKISWLLPLFLPLVLFFFFLGSFLSLFGKKWREILCLTV